MLAIGRCYNGLDLSDTEASNNRRVIERRKTRLILALSCSRYLMYVSLNCVIVIMFLYNNVINIHFVNLL